MCARPQNYKSPFFKKPVTSLATIITSEIIESMPEAKVYQIKMGDGRYRMMCDCDMEFESGCVIKFTGEFKKVGRFYGFIATEVDWEIAA